MGEAVEVQVLGGYGFALASVGPRLVVPNGAFGDRVASTRWSFDVATAAKVRLAACVAEVGGRAAESDGVSRSKFLFPNEVGYSWFFLPKQRTAHV